MIESATLDRVTVTAEVGINEGALGMIVQGYREVSRCLGFRVSFYRGEGAQAACELIDSYNEFDGKAVAQALASLGEVYRIEVGRERSPVLYIHSPTASMNAAKELMRAAKADEIDVAYPDVLRAWWD